MEITDLPAEMQVKVLLWLPLPALKEATLVSPQWRKMAEHPSLWKWCKVTVYNKDDIGNLAIRRIKNIREVKINPQNWDAEVWKTFFLATMELLSLKFIDGLETDGLALGRGALGTVEKGIFARALAKLEVVELRWTPYDQIEELFTEMSRNTQIKKLHLLGLDLSRIDPDTFAMGLSRLEDVLLSTRLDRNHQIFRIYRTTKDQMTAFFTQTLVQNSIKRLHLNEESIWSLEPGLFARALAKVEEVKLRNLGDDDNQVSHRLEALFTELLLNTQMKRLELMCMNMSQLEPGLVAGVLAKLEYVTLKFIHLTKHQKKAFFTELASRSTHLKTLDIQSMHYVGSVDPEVFAQAVTRLEELSLSMVLLPNDHYQSLFAQMALNTNLKKLEISGDNFRSVNPQVLAAALNKLDEVKLRCGLTPDQAIAFFSEMDRETKLKKLHLSNVLSALDPEILGTALTKLKEVTLLGTRLTLENIEAVLTHVLEVGSSKLKKLQWRDEAGGVLNGLNPETVRMLQDKLRGEFKLN